MTKITDEVRRLLDAEADIITVSARDDISIDTLEKAIVHATGATDIRPGDIMITNQRHYQALVAAGASIARAIAGLHDGLSGDLIAQDIREPSTTSPPSPAAITTDDILSTIFTRFCIGK